MGADAVAAIGGWPGVLTTLIGGTNLSTDQAAGVFDTILDGDAAPTQIAGMLVALAAKGPTADEITGFVRSMLAHAVPLELPAGTDVIDTCGTGGDRLGSINVSTIAALVVAATGAKVCKHGNRAASSSVGTADVLEELGVVVDLGPEGVARCIEEVGMGFCFAPRFHPAMRFAGPVRAELGIPTVFNFLGPLANPARARFQVIGVANPAVAGIMVDVLRANGTKRAMVVYGDDGLDELSTTGPSTIHELNDGEVTIWRLDPADLGLARATLEDLKGGDAIVNANAIRAVVGGETSPHHDIAVLNAAASLVVLGKAEDFAGGIALARSVIDGGQAAEVLERLIAVSREAAAGASPAAGNPLPH